MSAFLASVRNPQEAAVALAAGADIIDLKEPRAGALGAVPRPVQRACVQAVNGRRPVSATVGDLPLDPATLVDAVACTAATGVDIVKLGLGTGGDSGACIDALADQARRTRLVAVLFADQGFDPALLPRLAAAGFYGAMLDTAGKAAGGLRAHRTPGQLAAFVAACREHGLLCGLAGSLAAADIPHLLPLAPDYLGFRGALCGGRREASLDPAACRAVHAALRAEAATRQPAAASPA